MHTHIAEEHRFFRRAAVLVSLSVYFLFFAAKQNIYWNVQDQNNYIGGKHNNSI